jgi:hypothetical protein
METAAALSRLSTARAVRLWLVLQVQLKLDGIECFPPRPSLLSIMGLSDRAVLRRAATELEAAGLVAVYRRRGRPVQLKLLAPTGEKGGPNGHDGAAA